MEMVQQGHLVGAYPWGRPQVGLRPRRQWIYRRSPTNHRIDCPLLVRVPKPNPSEPWRVQHDVVGSAIIRSGAVATLEY